MKHFLAATLATLTLAGGTAALADDRYHGDGHGRYAHARYREGQMYRGHALHRYHGRWGYYRPHNGVNVFISI